MLVLQIGADDGPVAGRVVIDDSRLPPLQGEEELRRKLDAALNKDT